MPPKKAPITAEGLRVFLDDPIEGVGVIRSSNGLWAKSPLHFKPSAPKVKHARSTTPSEDSRVTKVSLRDDFCACPECAVPRCNYSACKVKSITGTVVEKPFTQIVSPAGVTTQSQSLAEFRRLSR
jgi:hypothetical protein